MTTRAVVGFFNDPESLIEATRKVKASEFKNFDVFTPYPVHGLDAAQGLARSWLPWVTFIAGLTGLACGFAFEYWTSAVDWPVIIGGKPFNSWPAFVPVMFECTVLFAALSTVGAMFAVNGLPNVKKKIVDPSITCDRFAIVVEEDEKSCCHGDEEEEATEKKMFNEQKALELMKSVGAHDVRAFTNEGWF